MTIIKNAEQMGALCREWQGRLRLQDWDIHVSIVRARDMKTENALGEVYAWNTAKKAAAVHLLDSIDYPADQPATQDMERDLVHELLHLHFLVLSEGYKEDSKEQLELERGVDAISKALVELRRGEHR